MGTGRKVVEQFCMLGRAMAKAMQDSRLQDLPLSSLFYRRVLPFSVLALQLISSLRVPRTYKQQQ